MMQLEALVPREIAGNLGALVASDPYFTAATVPDDRRSRCPHFPIERAAGDKT